MDGRESNLTAIPELIRMECPKLKVLHLWGNKIRHVEYDSLPPSLSELNLSVNYIETLDISTLVNLTKLRVRWNKATLASLSLAQNPNLTHLNV
jgi:Leucine-rich repeat (LRR) protein